MGIESESICLESRCSWRQEQEKPKKVKDVGEGTLFCLWKLHQSDNSCTNLVNTHMF